MEEKNNDAMSRQEELMLMRSKGDELHAEVRGELARACPDWRRALAGAAVKSLRMHQETCHRSNGCGGELLHKASLALVLRLVADIESAEPPAPPKPEAEQTKAFNELVDESW
jgi:hypothetical protein